MVALLGGAEIPVQSGMGLESIIGGGAVPYQLTTEYGDAQLIAKAQAEDARIRAEKEAQLAVMEATAAEAHEQYYEVGGTGYGPTPGGPDVYYFDYGQTQPTVYEQGSILGWEAPSLPGKDDLLLYGALAIGALALLKR